MKIELEREELQQIVAAHIAQKFGGVWACDGSDYNWPRAATFAQQTPESIAKAEQERIDAERVMAEWRAKQDAEQAAPAREQEQAAA